MARVLHAPERLDGSRNRKDPVRQREKNALIEKRRKLGEKLFGESGAVGQQPIEIDPEKLDVVAERLQAEFAVCVEIALPELHKAPIGPEDRKAFVDGVPCHRIQHYIDALAVGNFANIVREGERARVDDVVRPNPAEKLALLDRAGGSENFGADPQGILDGGQADTAGGPLNQDTLALLQSGEVVQRVIDRRDGDRERRSLLEAHGHRFFEQTVGGRNEMG